MDTTRLVRPLRRPETQTDLLQLAKATLATVLTFLLTARLLALEPFLATWIALLTVHATVHRSLVHGLQVLAATALGIGITAVLVQGLGAGAAALGLAVLLGLVAARAPGLRLEGVTVATTGLYLILGSDPMDAATLGRHLAGTGLGVVVALAVNLVVVAPLDDDTAGREMERVLARLGALLRRIATELPRTDDESDADRASGQGTARGWVEASRDLDEDLAHARELVRYSRETQSWNPRRLWSPHAGATEQWEDLAARLQDAVAHTRSIARVVTGSVGTSQAWDEEFRERWLGLLDEAGQRVADASSAVTAVRNRVDRLADDLSTENLPGLLWPTYGALLTALRGVLVAVDDEETVRLRQSLGPVGHRGRGRLR